MVLCDLPSSKGGEVAKSFGEDKVVFAPANVNYLIKHKNVLLYLVYVGDF